MDHASGGPNDPGSELIAGRHFDALFREELRRLEEVPPDLSSGEAGEGGDDDEPSGRDEPAADERNRLWRRTRPPRDLFGIAFSGGGIRSATFNLGMLQGLQRLGLLPVFDYLSTVSGGGYVGGFWTAWRHYREGWKERLTEEGRGGEPPGRPTTTLFPEGEDGDEPWPVRHLREFGNFLSPRLGLLSADTGRLVVAAAAGILPALVTSLALLVLVLAGWRALVGGLFRGDVLAVATVPGVTLLCLVAFEWVWQHRELTDTTPAERPREAVPVGSENRVSRLESFWYLVATACVVAAVTIGIIGYQRWVFDAAPPRLRTWTYFGPALVWVGVFLGYVVLRTLLVRALRDDTTAARRSAGDRIGGRVVFFAGVWGAFAVVFVVAERLAASAGIGSAGVGGGLLAVLGMAFAWARANAEKVLRTLGEDASLRIRLRTRLPSLLAYAAIAVVAVGIAVLITILRGTVVGGDLITGSWLVLLAALLFLDPNRISLHPFYRERIARAFLGAANPNADFPYRRTTEQLPGDDLGFSELKRAPAPPLHLVCTAANDLGAVDPLANLRRGAYSAVFSPLAFQVHNQWRAWHDHEELTLASALTASAAAFNPMMGRFSVVFGRAVTFVMAALGLRLGLWVKHPTRDLAGDEETLRSDLALSSERPAVPRGGAALGRSLRSLWRRARKRVRDLYEEHPWLWKISAAVPGLPVPGAMSTWAVPGRHFVAELASGARYDGSSVHLSDGAHFENLALYELIRRHCRYILVSDCGADPRVAFQDVANLIRRVRQDFGVEIFLDLSALEPGEDGMARQSVVAGDIRYPDGDTGVLLLFKPTLVGDEPADILQYRRHDATFPHQSTLDQFYDEAQWESYRRLGQHAVRRAFGFVTVRDGWWEEAPERADRHAAADLFHEARFRWLPEPEELTQRRDRVAARARELETELEEGLGRLFREVYRELPELEDQAVASVEDGDGEGRGAGAVVELSPEELSKSLVYVRQALHFMEGAYHDLSLETGYGRPKNLGVVNYFARWTGAPLLRMWWPVLKTMYDPSFTRFMERRFGLKALEDVGGGTERLVGALAPGPRPGGFAATSLLQQDPEAGERMLVGDAFEYRLTMRYALAGPGRATGRDYDLQAAILAPRRDGQGYFWRDRDLFVPPGLWGVGVGRSTVDAFVRGHVGPVTVAVTARPGPGRAREALLYKGLEFEEIPPPRAAEDLLGRDDDPEPERCLWLGRALP